MGSQSFPTSQRRLRPAERDEIVRRVTTLAGTRGGVASGTELVERGLRRKQIRSSGWLHDLGGDVFAVGHRALPPRAWLHAALLSGGTGAALSYWSAAVLWKLLDEAPNPNEIDVSTRRSARTGCRGAVIHRPRRLSDQDCTSVNGYRVTTLFRTLLDLASLADEAMLLRLVEAAHTLHGIDLLELAAYTRRHKRWPGAAELRNAAHSVAGPVRLRSDLEAMFRQLSREAGLPEYETNVPFEGQELDVFYRDRNAAIELDWWQYHGGKRAYRRDHRKARRLARAGIALLAIAGEDIEDDLHEVLADVRAFLDHHPVVADPILALTEGRAA
jgi:very-short-patch-repair endonuclease